MGIDAIGQCVNFLPKDTNYKNYSSQCYYSNSLKADTFEKSEKSQISFSGRSGGADEADENAKRNAFRNSIRKLFPQYGSENSAYKRNMISFTFDPIQDEHGRLQADTETASLFADLLRNDSQNSITLKLNGKKFNIYDAEKTLSNMSEDEIRNVKRKKSQLQEDFQSIGEHRSSDGKIIIDKNENILTLIKSNMITPQALEIAREDCYVAGTNIHRGVINSFWNRYKGKNYYMNTIELVPKDRDDRRRYLHELFYTKDVSDMNTDETHLVTDYLKYMYDAGCNSGVKGNKAQCVDFRKKINNKFKNAFASTSDDINFRDDVLELYDLVYRIQEMSNTFASIGKENGILRNTINNSDHAIMRYMDRDLLTEIVTKEDEDKSTKVVVANLEEHLKTPLVYADCREPGTIQNVKTPVGEHSFIVCTSEDESMASRKIETLYPSPPPRSSGSAA